MVTEPALGLEHHDAELGGEGPRGRSTSDPAADDGDIELIHVRATHSGTCKGAGRTAIGTGA